MVARNKQGKPLPNWKDPSKNGQNGFTSDFVQYELSKEQQATCKAWDFTFEDGYEALNGLVEAGYKITFRHDDRNNCSACWIIGDAQHKINGNMILPGRGSTPFKAFKQACFKHWKLFDTVWGEYVRKRETEEIDD